MCIAEQFASIFNDDRARTELAKLHSAGRTKLRTFNLSTTSLRHLPKWFDRLEDISQGHFPNKAHGNFFSDPAAIGLVNNATKPPSLTEVGKAFLAYKRELRNKSERAEYQLIKLLYSGDFSLPQDINDLLAEKRSHMLRVLEEFAVSSNQHIFLERPSLLAVLELVSGFQDAGKNFVQLPIETLRDIAAMGEYRLKTMCSGNDVPLGISRLCLRIANDYTRGEERRINYIVSMALLLTAQKIPLGKPVKLIMDPPFSYFLTAADLYRLHSQYTSDISIWFDGLDFYCSSSHVVRHHIRSAKVGLVEMRKISGVPCGNRTATLFDPIRNKRKSAKPARIEFSIDPVMSERAEDYVERELLSPQYGNMLVRVGHRNGESLSLPDGMVPGADFYIIDRANRLAAFIEVKSITTAPPAEISLTRAEYWRARDCAGKNIPYRLILVNQNQLRLYEIKDFAQGLSNLDLSEVKQFIIRVG